MPTASGVDCVWEASDSRLHAPPTSANTNRAAVIPTLNLFISFPSGKYKKYYINVRKYLFVIYYKTM
jgi:hypothetical protein